MKPINILETSIGGPADPPYVVAEISGNHNGSLDRMLYLIKLAHDNGADAIKIQSYEPQSLTLDSSQSDFCIKSGLWSGETLYSLYKKACTPFSWHKQIFEFAKANNITLFSSPFDLESVDLLESFNCPAYKIASFEIVDYELLKRVARTNKPIIVSTGMASIGEISDALSVLHSSGATKIILLKCTSAYPASPSDMNLMSLPNLQQTFQTLVGLSDHTIDNTSAIVSVALGACFIEKHFTDSRDLGGVDSDFSIEPQQLRALKASTINAMSSLGNVSYGTSKAEKSNSIFKRSLYFTEDIKQGGVISSSNMRAIRPGFGLHPRFYQELLGKKVSRDIQRGERVSWDCLS